MLQVAIPPGGRALLVVAQINPQALATAQQVRLGDADSIRLYRLCAGCVAQTAIWGVGEVSTDKDYYIT